MQINSSSTQFLHCFLFFVLILPHVAPVKTTKHDSELSVTDYDNINKFIQSVPQIHTASQKDSNFDVSKTNKKLDFYIFLLVQ